MKLIKLVTCAFKTVFMVNGVIVRIRVKMGNSVYTHSI